MIDTDKYEGQTEGLWEIYNKANKSQTHAVWQVYDDGELVAANLTLEDARLIADAPLLLEEVKRLRAIIEKAEMVCLETDNTEGAHGNLKRILEILVGDER